MQVVVERSPRLLRQRHLTLLAALLMHQQPSGIRRERHILQLQRHQLCRTQARIHQQRQNRRIAQGMLPRALAIASPTRRMLGIKAPWSRGHRSESELTANCRSATPFSSMIPL